MRLLEFFEEDNGRLSNMRLNCTVMVMIGCFLVAYSLIKSVTAIIDPTVITAATLMFTLGLGGKIVQKKDENEVK